MSQYVINLINIFKLIDSLILIKHLIAVVIHPVVPEGFYYFSLAGLSLLSEYEILLP